MREREKVRERESERVRERENKWERLSSPAKQKLLVHLLSAITITKLGCRSWSWVWYRERGLQQLFKIYVYLSFEKISLECVLASRKELIFTTVVSSELGFFWGSGPGLETDEFWASQVTFIFCGAQEKDETDPIIVEPLRFFRLLQVEITFSFYFLSHSLTQFIFISLSFYFLKHPLTLTLSFVYFLALSFHFLCLSIPQIPLSLP